MLANRVRKTFRKLQPGFERRGVGAFRLYDRDIPEIRAVVDWYEGHLVLGEYEREQTRGSWLEEMAEAVAQALTVPPGNVHLKRRRTGSDRYDRLDRKDERIAVREQGLRFLCNLDDYIDTGLFPDHRETRARIRREAAGARFLNLYGYTGSFTCAAAAGGAERTVTVDGSRTYLAWAKDNLQLNGLPPGELVCEDVLDYLENVRARFTLCVLDPPSFSTREGRSFDVQHDHPKLVERALETLEPGGVLYFSTNHQRFEPRLPPSAVEITAETVPIDYRNRAVHRAFRLTRSGG